MIGHRLRTLRERKKLSQGDIEKRTGLLRAYISRVEHGHTVPAIETLEKLAGALEVPLYQLFYEGEEPPELWIQIGQNALLALKELLGSTEAERLRKKLKKLLAAAKKDPTKVPDIQKLLEESPEMRQWAARQAAGMVRLRRARGTGFLMGDHLRALREGMKLSKRGLEKRTGLPDEYIARFESGHTVPSVETLEKIARALEVPLYQLFYSGEEPPKLPNLPRRKPADEIAWGGTRKEAHVLNQFRRLLSRIDESDRQLLLYLARKMGAREPVPAEAVSIDLAQDVNTPRIERARVQKELRKLDRELADLRDSSLSQLISIRSRDEMREKAFATVRVFYGTDRKPTGNNKPDRFFDAERGEGLSFGSVAVSIPHDHRMGQLEGPDWWKLEFRKDPAKHIVLLSLEPLNGGDFILGLRKSLQKRPVKEALVFVHGYNVSFEDACRRTAQIAYDLKFSGVPVAYSWPSEGKTKLYLVDETNVHWSVPHFRKFLSIVLSKTGADTVHVIAHSMGNRALVEALRTFEMRELPLGSARLTQVIFAAPDIDAETFKEIAEEFHQRAARFTLYASSRDVALKASKAVHKYPRAGDSGNGLVLLDGVDTIDATKVDTGLMGHSYIGDNDSILADVYYLLRDGSPPSKRFRLRRRERAGREYWMFQP